MIDRTRTTTSELADLIKSVNSDSERGEVGRRQHLEAFFNEFLSDQKFSKQMLNSAKERDRSRVNLLVRFLESGESGLNEKEVSGLLPVLRESQREMLKKAFIDADELTPFNKDYWRALGILVKESRAKISQFLKNLTQGPISEVSDTTIWKNS